MSQYSFPRHQWDDLLCNWWPMFAGYSQNYTLSLRPLEEGKSILVEVSMPDFIPSMMRLALMKMVKVDVAPNLQLKSYSSFVVTRAGNVDLWRRMVVRDNQQIQSVNYPPLLQLYPWRNEIEVRIFGEVPSKISTIEQIFSLAQGV